MNLALLLTLLPVLCTPVTGSLLRFPDTSILSIAPDTVEYSELGPFAGAWDDPPRVFNEVPEIADDDVAVTTEIDDEVLFGPKRNTPLRLPDPFRLLPQFLIPAAPAEPSDLLFLLTGCACFGMALFIRLPLLNLRRTVPEPCRLREEIIPFRQVRRAAGGQIIV